MPIEDELTDELLASGVSTDLPTHAILEQELAEEKGFAGTAFDMAAGALHGATDAVDETLQMGISVVDYGLEQLTGGEGIDDASYQGEIFSNLAPRPVTAAGKFVEEVVQFGVGMVGAGKFRRLAGATIKGEAKKGIRKNAGNLLLSDKTSSVAKKVAHGTIDSAAASFTVQDPYEETLAEYLNSQPEFKSAFSDYLANKVGDNEFERRMKNLGEDLSMSVAFWGIAKAWKGGKSLMGKDLPPEVSDAIRQGKDAEELSGFVSQLDPKETPKVQAVINARQAGVTTREYLDKVSKEELITLAKGANANNAGIMKHIQYLQAILDNPTISGKAADVAKEDIAKALAKLKDTIAGSLDSEVDELVKPISEVFDRVKNIKDTADEGVDVAKHAATDDTVEEVAEAGAKDKAKAPTTEQGTAPKAPKAKKKEKKEDLFPKQALDDLVKQLKEIEIPSKGNLAAEYSKIIKNATRGLSSKYWHNDLQDRQAIEFLQDKVLRPLIQQMKKEQGVKQVKTFESWYQVTKDEYARTIGVDVEELGRALELDTEDMYAAQTRLMALEIRIGNMYSDVLNLKELRAKTTNPAQLEKLEVKFLQLTDQLAKSTNSAWGLETAKGRILGAGRINLKKVDSMTAAEIRDVLKSAGNNRFFSKRSDKLKNLDDALAAAQASGSRSAGLKAIKGFQRYQGPEKFVASMTEAWRGLLLLSSSTGSPNLLSGFTETLLTPAERLIGSAPLPYNWVKKEGGGFAWDPASKEAFEATWLHIKHLKEGLGQGLRAFSYAFAHEKQTLDAYHGGMIELPGRGLDIMSQADMAGSSPMQITADNWNLDPNSIMGKVVNTGGSAFRLSFRFLGASDDLIKQTNYFASLKAKFHADALRGVKHGDLKQGQMEDWVDAQMKNHFEADGLTPKMGEDGNPMYDQDALDLAQDVTHTKPAWDGSIVKDVQTAVNNNPALGFFLPFIRTPSDLINKAYQRTPFLGRFSKRFKADLVHADPARRAQAKGRQMVGTMVFGAGAIYAYEGKITGSGPDDPAVNKVWRMTHQPNSIWVDGNWVSYNKLDPVGMTLGMIANAVEAGKNSATTKGTDLMDIMQAGTLAITATIGDKSALKGMINLATLFSNEIIGKEEKTENMIEDHVASWIPTILTQVSGAFNDTSYIKEASGLIEKIQRKSPWHNGDLPDRYNFITGKRELNPSYLAWGIPTKSFKKSKVLEELANLNHGFTGPTRSVGGVDLTDKQFSEWCESMGKIRLRGGRTLMQELKYVMQSREYDYDPDRTYFRDKEGEDIIQVKLIRAVMSKYKSAAKIQLLKNNPSIAPKNNRQAFSELFG